MSILKLITVAIVVQASWIAVASGDQSDPSGLSGAHRGRTKERSSKPVDLLMSTVPGREGSYLAVMLRGNSDGISYKAGKIAIYLVDPLESNSYTMTPLNVTPDGSIGVNNSDPSLVLNVDGRGKYGVSFSITSSNSGNTEGFTTAMEFDSSAKSKLIWGYLIPGSYKSSQMGQIALKLTPLNPDAQAIGTFSIEKGLNGRYAIEESQPGLFTLKATAVKGIGVEKQENPGRIGVFLKKGKSSYFVLIDPKNDSNVTVLEHQN